MRLDARAALQCHEFLHKDNAGNCFDLSELALSLLKYKDAVDQSRSQAERDESIAWLYSYNLDDVRATFAVRDYLRNLTF